MANSQLVTELFQQLLDEIDNSYDKTEGYLVHDLLKSFSIVMSKLSERLNELEKLIDVDNLSGDMLEKFVDQRKGIKRTKATFAKGQVTVSGNGVINVGDLFETTSGIQFKSLESKTIVNSGTVNIECLVSGNVGNVPANQITQMPVTLAGITSVNNQLPISDGYEAESDESLRERYYISLKTPATSGNVYHYLQWAKELSGVGNVIVIPMDIDIQGGIAEVEVILIDQNKLPASETLVRQVQDYIDPSSEGLGYGQAPIGAKCYVSAANGFPVDVSVSIVKSPEYTQEQVLENIRESITSYLQEIAFVSTYVSYAAISNAIYNSAGVEDYSNLLINNQTGNIPVSNKEVAILGGVVIV